MSTFLLPKVHIDALLTASIQWADHPEGFRYFWAYSERLPTRSVRRGNADRVGTMLWQANFARTGPAPLEEWGEPVDELPPYGFEELPGTARPLTVLSALACYEYQTADDPEDWRESEPYALLTFLQAEAVRRLPGFEDEPWPIEDRAVFQGG